MSTPGPQGQHRISQVYLKQFGYLEDDKWWLSVYKKGEMTTENVLIENFTKETNIFDLPYTDLSLKRHFENTSGLIESHYRTVISNLHNQKQLTSKNQDVLCHFVPNLICRTRVFRNFIDSILRTSETRDKFINEITTFTENENEIKEFLQVFKIDFQLNVAIGTLMNYMLTVFRQFNQVIIRNFADTHWLTTDNPVFVDKNDQYGIIIPMEAEIYFPLSKEFLLFMYHEGSEITTNPLRNLKVNKINTIDFETFDNINKKLSHNLDDYLIMPIRLEDTELTPVNSKQ